MKMTLHTSVIHTKLAKADNCVLNRKGGALRPLPPYDDGMTVWIGCSCVLVNVMKVASHNVRCCRSPRRASFTARLRGPARALTPQPHPHQRAAGLSPVVPGRCRLEQLLPQARPPSIINRRGHPCRPCPRPPRPPAPCPGAA